MRPLFAAKEVGSLEGALSRRNVVRLRLRLTQKTE